MFSRRNPAWLALPLLILTSLLVLAGFLIDLALSRSHEQTVGRQRLTHLTELIGEHTARSLEAVDILLRELSTDLSGHDRWQAWNPRTGFEYLATRHSRSLPQVRDLIIFDRMGDQRFISTQFPAGQINVRDRPYFLSLERGADFAMYGPYIGRNSGRYTYALARSLKDARQEFSGAAFAAIEPAYFQDFCWSIRISDDFEAVLVNTQGRIVASCRPTDLSQQSPLIGAHAHDVLAGGALKRHNPLSDADDYDGWLVAETNVSGFPDLRVLALVPERTLLQHWHQRLFDYVALASLVLLTLLAGGWLLHQHGRRLDQRNKLLEARHQQLELALAESGQLLEQQKLEAERANAAKSRFLAAASHDLRQPLHALALFASDLQRQIRLNKTEQLPQLSQQIQSSTEVISELLDSLLDLSRLDVAGISPHLADHSIREIFSRLSTSFDRAAQAKGLHLRFRDHNLCVFTDANLLERMLSNLISNSIRYTQTGGILVSARPRGNHVLVEVRDTGIGIPAEHQQAIFVEFYQVDNAARESHKGLGLGLSIVDRLARALGLRLELRSQCGRGTCFGFLLPMGEQNGLTHSPPALPAPSSTPTTICILGDSEALRETRQLVRSWGYPLTQGSKPETVQEIIITEAGLFPACHAQLPANAPLILLGAEQGSGPASAHYLTLPIRPARLRALLRRLEEELKA